MPKILRTLNILANFKCSAYTCVILLVISQAFVYVRVISPKRESEFELAEVATWGGGGWDRVF